MFKKSILVVVLLVTLAGCSQFNDVQHQFLQGEDAMQSAANADVIFVRAVQTGENTWTFHVTVEHPDTGWEDYA
ncbi:MAG: hypothetical protein KC496_05110, partial [Anaerolineae bacterium]|nr:hypothetical protein [Anaerolineae bacterium]